MGTITLRQKLQVSRYRRTNWKGQCKKVCLLCRYSSYCYNEMEYEKLEQEIDDKAKYRVKYADWIPEWNPDGTLYCLHCSNCDKDLKKKYIKEAMIYCPDCNSIMVRGIYE